MNKIDRLATATHDEASRQMFVSYLRKFVMSDLSGDMRVFYDSFVEPKIKSEEKIDKIDSNIVRNAMKRTDFYKVWSSLRYNAQEMTWHSVQSQIERALPRLIDCAGEASNISSVSSSLRLNPRLPIPKSVSSLDIHLMPGCFHTEYALNDVSVGAVYAHGTKVFSGALKKSVNKGKGGVADSVGSYLKIRHSDFKPIRILDLGCTIGSNLLPYHNIFPKAELYGIDVGAPVLRYAHARALAENVPVHFSQQNAENMDFEDGFFDLIVSSFFFHEIPVGSTKKIMREIFRLLAPGGYTIHMELPSESEVDHYYNFFLDWDAYHNNEPYYAAFRKLDPIKLLLYAGFEDKLCDVVRIPDRGGVTDSEFRNAILGEAEAPRHNNFASYYLFGARK